MKDTRVSVRMSKEVHQKLKILVIKRQTSINKFLLDYIEEELRKENENKNDRE